MGGLGNSENLESLTCPSVKKVFKCFSYRLQGKKTKFTCQEGLDFGKLTNSADPD